MFAQPAQGFGALAALVFRLGQQGDGAIEADFERILDAGKGDEFTLAFHIRAVAAEAGGNRLAGFRMFADHARQRQQAQGVIEGDRLRRHALGQGNPLRLFLAFRFAELDIITVGPLAQAHILAGFRILAQDEGAVFGNALAFGRGVELAGIAAVGIIGTADKGTELAQLEAELPIPAGRAGARIAAIARVGEDMGAENAVDRLQNLGDLQVARCLHGLGEILPEIAQNHFPVDQAGRNLVELVFQLGGKVVFDIFAEKGAEKGGDELAAVLGHEALLLETDIIAILQHRNDRGIGRRPADAQLLQRLDQAGFAVARRRLGEMLFGHQLAQGKRRIGLYRRQQPAVLILRFRIVAPFLVKLEEAGKADHAAGSAKAMAAIAGSDIDRGAFQAGIGHLAGNGALPDQLVELVLLVAQHAAQAFGQAAHIGGTDRFMRFLGVFGLGLVGTRLFGHEFGAEFRADHPAGGIDGLPGQGDAIGPHIGDQPRGFAADVDALIQALGDVHGHLGAEAQLARGFLLQCRSGEGRLRAALDRFGRNLCNAVILPLQDLHGGFGGLAGGEGEFLDPFPVKAHKTGRQRRPLLRLEFAADRPVFARLEGLDLEFAFADQAQRHRLHPPGRTRTGQLAPQYRRKGEAHQIVERPARLLGIDQIHVDIARMGDAFLHGAFGDFIEHHPLDIDPFQHPPRIQRFQHMPGNGLALAVGVGGQIQGVGAFDRFGDFAHMLGRFRIDLIGHGEIFLRSDGTVLGGQVAHMAVGCENREIVAKVFVDGFGLGRRFDDDDVHSP